MEMNRLKLLEKQKKEAERLIKQQAQQEQNRIHNKGFDRSRSKLNFNSQEESNAERKKYLKERSMRIASKNKNQVRIKRTLFRKI